MEKPSVALLCPIAEVVEPEVFKHTMAMVSFASQNGAKIEQIGTTKRQLIHTARNVLAKGFMSTTCEWGFWMDADMMLPPHTITRLIETAVKCNSKFVTGVYYQRLGKHLPVLWRKDPVPIDGDIKIKDSIEWEKDERGAYRHFYLFPDPAATKPFKADACGFGCVLTHREMFEKIPYPYFKTLTDVCSEDFYFCVEAKKAGYQLIADPSLTIGHMSEPVWVTKTDCVMDSKTLVEIEA